MGMSIANDLAIPTFLVVPQSIISSQSLRSKVNSRSFPHLFSQLCEHSHSIRQDCLDTPTRCHSHFPRIIHCPNTYFLPCLSALFQELLPVGTHEQSKVDREPITCVPKVLTDDLWGKTDMISAEKREMVVCGPKEERVPQTEDQTRSQGGLPRWVSSKLI